jgi:hypothetical protein
VSRSAHRVVTPAEPPSAAWRTHLQPSEMAHGNAAAQHHAADEGGRLVSCGLTDEATERSYPSVCRRSERRRRTADPRIVSGCRRRSVVANVLWTTRLTAGRTWPFFTPATIRIACLAITRNTLRAGIGNPTGMACVSTPTARWVRSPRYIQNLIPRDPSKPMCLMGR